MTITNTQRQILVAAARHPNGIATPPPSLPPAPRTAVAKALLKAELLVQDEAEQAEPSSTWKLDDQTVVLRITDAGRRAVNGTAPNPAIADHDKPLVGTNAEARGALLPRIDLHQAARAVISAWEEADGALELQEALDHLRQVLTEPYIARSTQPRRPPRHGTKQEAVLALLRRPEGASGPQLIEATGWAPHTVRGFLAGVGKKGIAVSILKRVRQVGPGKEGAKGSYTVYRIAEAG